MVNFGPARRRPPLSEEEWVILLDYFFTNPEPTHTDSHPLCQQLARLIGRSPGTVDSSLRNLKAIHTGTAGLSHGSRVARRIYERYHDQQQNLHDSAQGLTGQLEILRGQPLPDQRREALRRLQEFNRQHRNLPSPSTSRDASIFHRPRGARTDLLIVRGTTCQICNVPGFETRLGTTYAEVHHLDELARRLPGNLCTDNTLVVCPTCHAKIHNANVATIDLPNSRIRITINGRNYDVDRNTEGRLADLA